MSGFKFLLMLSKPFMRTISALTVLLLVMLTGCAPMVGSGIPKALSSDVLIRTAGSSQGLSIVGSGEETGNDSGWIMSERRFQGTISSGTAGQLVAAYRTSVERTVKNFGGAIRGTGMSGSTNDLTDFSFDYTWGGIHGVVRGYSFAGTNGQVEVILFCYEHRK